MFIKTHTYNFLWSCFVQFQFLNIMTFFVTHYKRSNLILINAFWILPPFWIMNQTLKFLDNKSEVVNVSFYFVINDNIKLVRIKEAILNFWIDFGLAATSYNPNPIFNAYNIISSYQTVKIVNSCKPCFYVSHVIIYCCNFLHYSKLFYNKNMYCIKNTFVKKKRFWYFDSDSLRKKQVIVLIIYFCKSSIYYSFQISM